MSNPTNLPPLPLPPQPPPQQVLTQISPTEGDAADTGGAEVVGAARAVLHSLQEFPRIVGMIQGALGHIGKTRDDALDEVRGAQNVGVAAIEAATDRGVASINAAASSQSQSQNADNPNFQTPENSGYAPSVPGQPF